MVKAFVDKLFNRFFKMEATGGILLMTAALAAMIAANSPLKPYYDALLNIPVEVRINHFEIAKPLLLWINDGLMAIFFFMIGLELKREMIEGEFKAKKNILLPAIGAIGGMALPAVIFTLFNRHDAEAMQGWAIPTATDIAFALAVLALLGSRVPTSMKIFLSSLAIFDDLGAIVIIALFYTANISAIALIITAICMGLLLLLNRLQVTSKAIYLMIGMVMWAALLKSGIHATLAGVVLALFIPMRDKTNPQYSPLISLERDLQLPVAILILPLFAFANAGLNFTGLNIEQVSHHVPLGIGAGLLIGKQLGVFSSCWIAVKSGLNLPLGMTFRHLYGAALLCGIGFTMSLFIGSLAFEVSRDNMLFDERIGIIAGSLLSGICGYLWLRCNPHHRSDSD